MCMGGIVHTLKLRCQSTPTGIVRSATYAYCEELLHGKRTMPNRKRSESDSLPLATPQPHAAAQSAVEVPQRRRLTTASLLVLQARHGDIWLRQVGRLNCKKWRDRDRKCPPTCYASPLPRSGGSRNQSLAARSLIFATSHTTRAWVLKSRFIVGNRLDASTTPDAHRDANLIQRLPSTAMHWPHLCNTLRNIERCVCSAASRHQGGLTALSSHEAPEDVAVA